MPCKGVWASAMQNMQVEDFDMWHITVERISGQAHRRTVMR